LGVDRRASRRPRAIIGRAPYKPLLTPTDARLRGCEIG
jgi:hypothetical protein